MIDRDLNDAEIEWICIRVIQNLDSISRPNLQVQRDRSNQIDSRWMHVQFPNLSYGGKNDQDLVVFKQYLNYIYDSEVLAEENIEDANVICH